MADLAPTIFTTAQFDRLGAYGSFSGQFESFGDKDAAAISLQAGVTYAFWMQAQTTGSSSGDAFMTLLDPAGTAVASDDNSGAIFGAAGSGNANFIFTPTISGTYFLQTKMASITDSGPPGAYNVTVFSAPITVTMLTANADSTTGDFNYMGVQGNDTITGGISANSIFGGMGDDSIAGGSGGDTLLGEAGNDHILGGFGNDSISGGDGFDWLEGGDDNDRLDGNSGDDYLDGGAGNDTYVVDSLHDLIVEPTGHGTDTLNASASYFLAAGVEIETLQTVNAASTSSISLNGNEFAQQVIGNAGNNFLSGGNDSLQDLLVGNAGNDSYFISASDIIVETSGIDLVTSFIDINLNSVVSGFDKIENLTLAGFATFGDGNARANIMTGNEQGNLLLGEGNHDKLSGLLGNDRLYGGVGLDTLTGGGGNDAFVFNEAAGTFNRDTITDFTNATGNNDFFRLENAFFTKFATTGVIKANFFRAGTAALDADDFIVYNKATGAVFYDSNGSGAGGAIQIATLTNKATLTAADFYII